MHIRALRGRTAGRAIRVTGAHGESKPVLSSSKGPVSLSSSTSTSTGVSTVGRPFDMSRSAPPRQGPARSGSPLRRVPFVDHGRLGRLRLPCRCRCQLGSRLVRRNSVGTSGRARARARARARRPLGVVAARPSTRRARFALSGGSGRTVGISSHESVPFPASGSGFRSAASGSDHVHRGVPRRVLAWSSAWRCTPIERNGRRSRGETDGRTTSGTER
jgi:hypothetical protein